MEGLQATLAAEHGAVYLYGLLGGRTSVSAHPRLAGHLREGYSLHRDRRDQLETMVRRAGGEPVVSEVAYAVDGPVRTAAQVTAHTLAIEHRCADVYADLVGSTWGANRQWALDALTDAALRVLLFGGEPEPFPGLPER